jgi:hypothetical protein
MSGVSGFDFTVLSGTSWTRLGAGPRDQVDRAARLAAGFAQTRMILGN